MAKYTIEELVAAAKELGFSPVLVAAALKSTKKKRFTLEQAKKIVADFAGLEVKG